MNARHAAVLRACRAAGIAIHELEQGAVHLIGPGVDLKACDLAAVTREDLRPCTSDRQVQARLDRTEASQRRNSGARPAGISNHPGEKPTTKRP